MAVGNNEGGQLNLIMWELSLLRRDPTGILPDTTIPLAIQPMVTAPKMMVYSDTTRGGVTETTGGAVRNIAGRSLLSVDISGDWGVESRGLAGFIGTGQLRHERFWQEIVRLTEAVTKDDVNAAKDLARSPILTLLLNQYNEKTDHFVCNFYDFYNEQSFECIISRYVSTRQARNGGATGNISYSMTVQEVGPIVVGNFGTKVLQGLFDVLTTWDNANELIKSYTLDAVLGSFSSIAGILGSQLGETLDALQGQVDSVTGVMNGYSQGRTVATTTDSETGEIASENGLETYLPNAEQVSRQADETATAIEDTTPADSENATGSIRWSQQKGEGDIDALERADTTAELTELSSAASFQGAAGALYGLSREEYAAYISSVGNGGQAPTLLGSVEHTVTVFDTSQSLERQFQVRFDAILELNNLDPDELLTTGRKILIPQERLIGPQSSIEGLPVFGSHAGRSALGRDIPLDFAVDGNGRMQIVSEGDCIKQGMNWIIDERGDELLKAAQGVADIVAITYLETKIKAFLQQDRRVAAINNIQTNITDNGVYSVGVDITAINGTTVSTIPTN